MTGRDPRSAPASRKLRPISIIIIRIIIPAPGPDAPGPQ